MQNKQYWVDRLNDIEEYCNDKILLDFVKELEQQYTYLDSWLDTQISKIYAELGDSRDIINLNKCERYKIFKQQVKVKLSNLAQKEIDITTNAEKDVYKYTFKKISKDLNLKVSLSKEDVAIMDKIIASKFLDKHFSDRIWDNKKVLLNTLNQELQKCVVLGQDWKKASKTLRQKTGNSKYNCDRIIRTECNKTLNECAKNRYVDAGFTEYQYMATKDERTCSICKSLDGKVFKFTEAIVGVNMPPLHPHTRSTIIPIVE